MSEVPTNEEIKVLIELSMSKNGFKKGAILLDPERVEQNIINLAKIFGVEVLEMAEYQKTETESLYEKTMIKINSLIEVCAAREHVSE